MAQNDENSPILIRGPNGIPVGVVSPSSKDKGGHCKQVPGSTLRDGHQPSRVPSSVLKATAVRKTATTKKKRTEVRDGKNKNRIDIASGDADAVWRPLGAAFLGGEAALAGGTGDISSLSIQHQTPLLQPPRMSEEVRPVNLQGLFDDTSVNEFSKVQVYVRIRPEGVGGGRDQGGGSSSVHQNRTACLYVASMGRLGVSAPLGSLAYKSGDCNAGRMMAFNRVFGPQTSQMEYYTQTSKVLVEQLVQRERYEGVFLSYGITAAGKTYTIQGTKENPGIIPLALQTLFGKLSHCKEMRVEISYCEIYNEAIYDLLLGSETGGHCAKRPALRLMEARDGSIMVEKLSWVRVEQAQEAWNVLRRGMKQRKRAATKLNYSSSRSHSVCSIRLVDLASGKNRKLSFVDLAGSERAHRTGTAEGTTVRLKEAVAINGSLMTLGRCLEALRLNQKNRTTSQVIPYRESKVTHLFRDALHGYGNVVLSVNVSPAPADFDETLRVLKYAMTANQIATTGAKPVKPSQLWANNGIKATNRDGSSGQTASRPNRSIAVEGCMSGFNAISERDKQSLNLEDHDRPWRANSPTKLGRLRKETPMGLKRHRELMEMGQQKETKVFDVSVSIDSRVHGASPSPPLPQLLCEEELDNRKDIAAGERPIIHDEVASSSYDEGDDESNEDEDGFGEQDEEEDGGVTMRGGKPVRSFAMDATRDGCDKDSIIEGLKLKLKEAEDKLLQVEAEVRDEVATEMTQIIDTVEATHKQQIEEEIKKSEARMKILETRREKELSDMEGAIESQKQELDELRCTVADLERRASRRRKKLAAAEEDAQRYKSALNDALEEIEKLHGIIEQEEEANAKLAASLSEILREQLLPDSPDTNFEDLGEVDDLNGSKNGNSSHGAAIAKIRRIKREVTQIEANNAMEKDMSDHLIDRLKKDNDALRSKLAAMTHAIETCCTPSRNAVMQNLVTACPAGVGRGASGTPHEVALARARRLLESPVEYEESPKNSTKSRFAKEAANESPRMTGGRRRPGSLQEVGEADEVQLLEALGTPVDGDNGATPHDWVKGPDTDSVAATAATEMVASVDPPRGIDDKPALKRSPRRSPRKHISSTAHELRQGTELLDEPKASPERGPEVKLPKTSSRVTRRARTNNGTKGGKKDVSSHEDDKPPPRTVAKTRKLLSTAKKQPPTAGKQTPMQILGVSSARKPIQRSGMPTAEELGLRS